MTHQQMKVLRFLADQKVPPTPPQVARAVGCNPGQMLGQLQQQGLVARDPERPSSGRVILTDTGRGLLGERVVTATKPPKLNRVDQQVLKAVHAGKGTANEIQRRVSRSIPFGRLRRSLQALAAAGLVECVHEDRNPLLSVWVPKGRDA